MKYTPIKYNIIQYIVKSIVIRYNDCKGSGKYCFVRLKAQYVCKEKWWGSFSKNWSIRKTSNIMHLMVKWWTLMILMKGILLMILELVKQNYLTFNRWHVVIFDWYWSGRNTELVILQFSSNHICSSRWSIQWNMQRKDEIHGLPVSTFTMVIVICTESYSGLYCAHFKPDYKKIGCIPFFWWAYLRDGLICQVLQYIIHTIHNQTIQNSSRPLNFR